MKQENSNMYGTVNGGNFYGISDALMFTDLLKVNLKAKSKPEPWLHCQIVMNRVTLETGQHEYHIHAAIFVWDTRETIEVIHNVIDGAEYTSWLVNLKRITRHTSPYTFAKDNKEPLVCGNMESVTIFNELPMKLKFVRF